MSNYRDELSRAITATHGGTARWLESVPVREVFRGKMVWEGRVEVFALEGHPRAARCFAWGARRDDDTGWDVTAVLAVPAVSTPELAVRAAIAAARPR